MNGGKDAIEIRRLEVNVPSFNVGMRRTNIFRHLLDHVVDPAEKTLLDLGAGPCIFAQIARNRGYQVTAVDGRTVRVPAAEELGTIRFVEANVLDFDPSGFGLIIAFGLIYHLTIDGQLSLLRRCAYGPTVIVETEVHDPSLVVAAIPAAWQTTLVEDGPYEGVVFTENDNPMASIGNPQSFWHTERSILRLFRDSGYRQVTIIEPRFQSAYGGRQFFLLKP